LVDTVDGKPVRVGKSDRNTFVRARAGRWITQLAASPLSGIQLDAAGELSVIAGKGQFARAAFNKRLETRELSLEDRMYTLQHAVQVFAQGDDSASMRIAHEYMQRLDALPAEANAAKYVAHYLLAQAYYDVGNSPASVAELRKTLLIAAKIPYAELALGVGNHSVDDLLQLFAEVASGDSHLRTTIDSVGQCVLGMVQASPAMIANDKTRSHRYTEVSEGWVKDIRLRIEQNSMLGTSAPPAIATHWYNAAAPLLASNTAPGARQIPTADGRIRVFEFGGLGCEGCLHAIPKMERLRAYFAGAVDFWYMTDSPQRWGAQDCTPDESAEHMRNYYVAQHKVTLPMGVWAPPVDDSASVPDAVVQRSHPTFEAYHIQAIPVFVVVDGLGHIRRIARGDGRNLEQILKKTVTYLLAEAKDNSVSDAQ